MWNAPIVIGMSLAISAPTSSAAPISTRQAFRDKPNIIFNLTDALLICFLE